MKVLAQIPSKFLKNFDYKKLENGSCQARLSEKSALGKRNSINAAEVRYNFYGKSPQNKSKFYHSFVEKYLPDKLFLLQCCISKDLSWIFHGNWVWQCNFKNLCLTSRTDSNVLLAEREWKKVALTRARFIKTLCYCSIEKSGL